ncbi:phage holin family protein [Sutterella wadsworthensis]|uniref:phage holin family protein n=1 Tax=Sutterella wadsworthensis TaxID=40545 RepID=UPI003A921C34
MKVQEGKAFTWREFLLHGAISAVCGLISYEVLFYEGFPPQLCGALSGMAGWGGTRVIRLLEVVLQKRLGLDKEDLK